MMPSTRTTDQRPTPETPAKRGGTLSPLARWTRAIRALLRVLREPEATDDVLVFLQLANRSSLPARSVKFFADPRGARLYAEQRKIDSHTIDVDELLTLPEGTLGHAYATFLRSHGLTPDVFDHAPAGITDPKLAYVIQRGRQTHDLWHVVTGCETDPAGEIALQAFTYGQTHTPGNGILAIAGTLKGMRQSPGIVRDVVALFRTGSRARRLSTFAWEDHWRTPLVEVRAMLGLPAAPLRRHAA